jgi:hypothetical protein
VTNGLVANDAYVVDSLASKTSNLLDFISEKLEQCRGRNKMWQNIDFIVPSLD